MDYSHRLEEITEDDLIRTNFIDADSSVLNNNDSDNQMKKQLNRVMALTNLHKKVSVESRLAWAKSAEEELLKREERKIVNLLQKENNIMDLNRHLESKAKQESKRLEFLLPAIKPICMFDASDEDYDVNEDDSCDYYVNSDSDSEYGNLPEHSNRLDTCRETEDGNRVEYETAEQRSSLSPGYQFETASPSLHFIFNRKKIVPDSAKPNDAEIIARIKTPVPESLALSKNIIPETLLNTSIIPEALSTNTRVIPETLPSAICIIPDALESSKISKSKSAAGEILASNIIGIRKISKSASATVGTLTSTKTEQPETSISHANANIIPATVNSIHSNSTLKPIIKRPFLKKGTGLSRFYSKMSLNEEDIQKCVPKTKSLPNRPASFSNPSMPTVEDAVSDECEHPLTNCAESLNVAANQVDGLFSTPLVNSDVRVSEPVMTRPNTSAGSISTNMIRDSLRTVCDSESIWEDISFGSIPSMLAVLQAQDPREPPTVTYSAPLLQPWEDQEPKSDLLSSPSWQVAKFSMEHSNSVDKFDGIYETFPINQNAINKRYNLDDYVPSESELSPQMSGSVSANASYSSVPSSLFQDKISKEVGGPASQVTSYSSVPSSLFQDRISSNGNVPVSNHVSYSSVPSSLFQDKISKDVGGPPSQVTSYSSVPSSLFQDRTSSNAAVPISSKTSFSSVPSNLFQDKLVRFMEPATKKMSVCSVTSSLRETLSAQTFEYPTSIETQSSNEAIVGHSQSSPGTSVEYLSDTEAEEDTELHLFELMEALTERPSFTEFSEVAKKFVKQEKLYENLTEELKEHNKELASEKEQLEILNEELMNEKTDLLNSIEELLQDKNVIYKENKMMQVQGESDLRRHKSNWEKEKKTLLREKEMLIRDNNTLLRDKKSLVNEKKNLLKENGRLMTERQYLLAEKDAWLIEKNRIMIEKDNLVMDQARFAKEKEVWMAEKRSLTERRNPSVETGLQITESRLSNGDISVQLDNGTTKFINSDGQEFKFVYRNGDIKELQPDGTIKYLYGESQVCHVTQPDGVIVMQFPDGQTETLKPDGSKQIVYPNKVVRNIQPDGSEEYKYPNRTVARAGPNGIRTFTYPNGQQEFHFENCTKRVFADGTVKIVFSDGSTETKYRNGRIRTKDPSGKLIYDTGDPPPPEFMARIHDFIYPDRR